MLPEQRQDLRDRRGMLPRYGRAVDPLAAQLDRGLPQRDALGRRGRARVDTDVEVVERGAGPLNAKPGDVGGYCPTISSGTPPRRVTIGTMWRSRSASSRASQPRAWR